MSGVSGADELGREEKQHVVLLQEDTSFDDDEDEEAMTQMHPLEGATWRDMRVGQQAAGDLFEPAHAHSRWPINASSFSFGGILGGVSSFSSKGVEGRGSIDSSPWWRQSIGDVQTAKRMWMVVAGVVFAVFVAVAVTSGGSTEDREGDDSPLSAGTSHSKVVERGGTFYETSLLRSRLQEVADAALAEGITLPMHTTFEIVHDEGVVGDSVEGAWERGMDFIISVITTKALEAKSAIAAPPSDAASSDPFDSRVLDPRMTVEDLPPAHSLVLNKFNTVRNHALIITKEFQSQDEALTEADFSAWYRVVEQLPAVGFYNSAVEAGASQRHKHMQVIPEEALWEYRPQASQAIPVDEPISRLVGSSRDFSRVWRVPGFDFQHAFTLLPSLEELPSVAEESADDLERMAGYLRQRYVTLLGEVGFDASSLLRRDEPNKTPTVSPEVPSSALPPYNALLTTRWLMVVPRSRRDWGGIDVNGMGFFGALLVREKAFGGEGAGVEAVRGPGPLTVLKGVTFQNAS